MSEHASNGGPLRPTDLLTDAERATLIGSMRPEDAEPPTDPPLPDIPSEQSPAG